METTTPIPPICRKTRGCMIVVGVAIVANLVVLYGCARTRDSWPSGHPWSGIANLCLAVALLSQKCETIFDRQGKPTLLLLWCIVVCAAIAASLWTLQTFANWSAASP